MTFRTKQVADIVRKSVSESLMHSVQDPRLADVRLTDVRVSPDLARAQIYFTLLDAKQSDDVGIALKKAAGFLRSELAHNTAMRRVPKLYFEYDTVLDAGTDLLNLINKSVAEDIAE